jgi:hypothetical protein
LGEPDSLLDDRQLRHRQFGRNLSRLPTMGSLQDGNASRLGPDDDQQFKRSLLGDEWAFFVAFGLNRHPTSLLLCKSCNRNCEALMV